jgi:SAM-dependent methyltransferase
VTVPFYARPSLHVEAYDVLHATVPGGDDLAFFTALADEVGGPILELGCGTGRLTVPLAEAGFEIVGLDRSEPMLALARGRVARLDAGARDRIAIVEADVRSYELDRTFGLVFAAFRVFMALTDQETQLEALATVRRHLRPDGRLALDVFDPRLDMLTPGTHPIERRLSGTLPSGNRVDAGPFERTNDPISQVLVERWRFLEIEPDGRVVRDEEETLTLRWTYRHEMGHLLARAGFDVLAEYGDYSGGPPAYGAEQIWIARPTQDPR